jgi:hypothetical protein
VLFGLLITVSFSEAVDNNSVKNRVEVEVFRKQLEHINSQHTLAAPAPVVSVREILQERLPAGCSYNVISGQPSRITPSAILHLFNGKRFLRNTIHPHCETSTHSIFLNSLKPDHCLAALDFEWVECGGDDSITAHDWMGQIYVFMCRESPNEVRPLLPHWIDGGNGLCSLMPTNWVPQPLYLTEEQPVPLLRKRAHPLVTNTISHSYSKVRVDTTAAFIARNISFHRFGNKEQTTTIDAYLQSFNSRPLLQPTLLEYQRSRLEKENAIRWSKFHLALEHASQNGYMSEKVWECLRVGTVPIYYGAPEARFFLPPHSTIFMSDFDSYDALIDYVIYLDKNDTAYLEYLQWKEVLKEPTHPYTQFLSQYGQGALFRDHLCVVDEQSNTILAQLKKGEQPEPFLSEWTDWETGQQCTIPKGGCAGRADIRDPPTHFHCQKTAVSLQPYSFPGDKTGSR